MFDNNSTKIKREKFWHKVTQTIREADKNLTFWVYKSDLIELTNQYGPNTLVFIKYMVYNNFGS